MTFAARRQHLSMPSQQLVQGSVEKERGAGHSHVRQHTHNTHIKALTTRMPYRSKELTYDDACVGMGRFVMRYVDGTALHVNSWLSSTGTAIQQQQQQRHPHRTDSAKQAKSQNNPQQPKHGRKTTRTVPCPVPECGQCLAALGSTRCGGFVTGRLDHTAQRSGRRMAKCGRHQL